VTAAGFLILPLGWQQRREVQQILVEMRTGSPPQASWRVRGNLRGGAVQYRTLVESGGSGGEEHVLQVWRARPDGYLWLEQTIQSEWGRPDFELGWQILNSVNTL